MATFADMFPVYQLARSGAARNLREYRKIKKAQKAARDLSLMEFSAGYYLGLYVAYKNSSINLRNVMDDEFAKVHAEVIRGY